MTQADPYFLGHRQAEQERLQIQGRELAAEANWLFDQLDLPLGAQVIELGCGPRGCLDLLAERVACASGQPGHRSPPSRRRMTHQLDSPRHFPCMNSKAAPSPSLTWSLLLVQSSIADHLLIRPQPIEPGAEDMDDREQGLARVPASRCVGCYRLIRSVRGL
jgi:hypothetical protein